MRKFIMILRISLDPRNIAMFLKIRDYFKKDPLWSIGKIVKIALNAIKGEKLIKFKDRYVATSFLPPFPSNAFMSVIHAVPPSETPFTAQATGKRTGPISCFLALTQACDLSCAHCSAHGRVGGEELTTAEWKSVIAQLQNIGTAIIGFTGGEPLLRPDITDIISSVDDRSVSILYTNGSRLDKTMAMRLADSGLYAVGISLDSADADEHDRNRGKPGAHAAALKALETARDAGLYTIAQTVAFRKYLDEKKLLKLFALAKKHGAHEVRILEPIPSGKMEDNIHEGFLDVSERERLKALQYRANRSAKFPKITTFAHTESSSQYGCGAGTQHSYISFSGDLFPCDFVPLSFGNVRHGDLEKTWAAMNAAMGIPGCECYAFRLKEELKARSDKTLPVPKRESCEICARTRGTEPLPKFYSILQGKK